MTERKYNFIYEKLVCSQDDLVGMIAYSLYKKHKIEFITHIMDEKGRDPNDEECDSFFTSSTVPTQLNHYREQAENLLSSMVARASTAEISRVEKDMLRQYQKNIKDVLPPWWHSVLWSVVASFVFAGIGLFYYYIGQKDKQEQSLPLPAQQVEIVLKTDTVHLK